MSTQALKDAVAVTPGATAAPAAGGAVRTVNPAASFERVLVNFAPQLERALPAHMKASRLCRLALTAFQTTPHLADCDGKSVLASLMTAGVLGLEPGVNGQGWLIPYFNRKANGGKGGYVCQFVPGWKGLGDLVARSGRAGAWTGAVFAGDQFDWGLGDRPFIRHKPGENSSGELGDLTHVYAVGRVNGAEWPVVEVWPIAKVWRHRDKYNKQGEQHYSFREPEMYGRKVPFLQVLKYLPSSIEIARALALSDRQEQGVIGHLDPDGFVDLTNAGGPDEDGVVPPPPPPADPAPSSSRTAKPRKGSGGGAAAATVEDVRPTAAAVGAPAPGPKGDGPGYTAEDYERQVLDAKDQDSATTVLDLARSELGEAGSARVLHAYKAKFPGR